jgi:hypothetical protein
VITLTARHIQKAAPSDSAIRDLKFGNFMLALRFGLRPHGF